MLVNQSSEESPDSLITAQWPDTRIGPLGMVSRITLLCFQDMISLASVLIPISKESLRLCVTLASAATELPAP